LLSKVDHASKSFRVLTTYQPDRLLQHYSDEALLGWAKQLAALLPESLRTSLRSVVEFYLDAYRTDIKPRSSDILRAYRQANEDDDELVTFNAGRIVANFPPDTLYPSCTSPHVARFWLRRILHGTDVRVEALAARYLSGN
jgi:hypothetical protein